MSISASGTWAFGLEARGVDTSLLKLSANAHVIASYNRTLDKVTERFLGKNNIHLVWGPGRHIIGHNVAAYLELDTDPFAGLSMTAAGRYDAYFERAGTTAAKVAGARVAR